MSYQEASAAEAKAQRPHRKFTPERVQRIKGLVARGESREQIAAIIGVTVGTLQVSCSRLGISLRRPRVKLVPSKPAIAPARTACAEMSPTFTLDMKYRGQ